MKEIFKKLEGTPFEISNTGRVKKNGVLYHPIQGKYPELDWQVKGHRNRVHIHKAMATLFLPNPQNRSDVNAKDGNYHNLQLDNLEWVTRSEACRGLSATELKRLAILLNTDPTVRHLEFLGYPGYWVTTKGEVFTLKHQKKVCLKQVAGNHGYNVVSLSGDSCSARTLTVHRLVALAFIPNTDEKPHVNHKDSIKSNNSASNLEWCTQKENNDHSLESGARRAIPTNLVPEVCRLLEEGTTPKDVSERFGVAIHAVIDIKRNRTHLDVSKDYHF